MTQMPSTSMFQHLLRRTFTVLCLLGGLLHLRAQFPSGETGTPLTEPIPAEYEYSFELSTFAVKGKVQDLYIKQGMAFIPLEVYASSRTRNIPYLTNTPILQVYQKNGKAFDLISSEPLDPLVKKHLLLFYTIEGEDGKSKSLLMRVNDTFSDTPGGYYMFLNMTAHSMVEIAGAFDENIFKLDPNSFRIVEASKIFKPEDTEGEMEVILAYKYTDGNWYRFYNSSWRPTDRSRAIFIIYDTGNMRLKVRKVIENL